jgi:ubiquinone/menaquinone biosynthesis C-methylase UbiE
MNTSAPGSGKTREEIAAAYKSEPWWYDVRGFFILTFAYNSTLPQQLRFFGRNFGPSHLELACGTGTLLELVLRWRRWKGLPEVDITGVDYAESMLAGAIHRFRRQPRMKFRHADAADMPFPENTFDTVNIANSMHCFPDLNGALRGVQRVLKPGGTLAANVLLYPRGSSPLAAIANRINRWGIRKGILYTPYERADIRARIQAAGFLVQEESVSGNCYNVLAVKVR